MEAGELRKKELKELGVYRKLLFVGGAIYFFWWFAVGLLLPKSFNPILSRLLVVAVIFVIWMISFSSEWVTVHIRPLFIACLWLITLHYYYLFYGNQGDINWIVGCYVTVIAVNLCFFSTATLFLYTIYVILLSVGLLFLVPSLRNSVFLPGLITIVFQANMGMRSRFKLFKNLKESNERFQLLFDSAFEGILVHENRRILDVNKSLAQMFGFSKEELIGKDALDLISQNQRAFVTEKIEKGNAPPYETIGLKKNGSTIEIELHGKYFKHDTKRTRLVTVQNIGDKKRAEKERIATQAMAESVRIRDEFISIASHELNTPLTSLKLQSQLIGRRISKNDLRNFTPEGITKFVSLVNKQTERLSRLVDAMLDVSRISTDKMILDRKKIDLIPLIREVLDFLHVHDQNDTISFFVESSSPIFVLADQYRIEQVVENLLINSIKYGDKKPITLTLKTEGPHVLLTVRDRGIGIAPENLKRIFDRFERAIPAQNISGLGLGLYITKQIVDAHGGTISVESKMGMGSTFAVRLPMITTS